LLSADFWSTTLRSGGGSNVTPRKIQRRLRLRLRPTKDSWRVDETYIRVKGKWVYLYRAVDPSGATIDFLLSAKRDAAAAERFLGKALGGENHPALFCFLEGIDAVL
jgi:transposase-like protein